MTNVDTSIPPQTTGAAARLAARHSAEHPLKLYGGWFCPFVQRAWIALVEKKIEHQYVEINPYKKEPEFLALNPRGLVPALGLPDPPRTVLYESSVVCEYLDERYADEAAHGRPLLPGSAYERARARLWIDHVSTRVIPGFYKLLQHTDGKSALSIEETRKEFLGHVRTLVKEMASSGPFFLGETFSLVDISLAPWAKRLWLIDHYKNGGVGIPQEGQDGDDEVWGRWRAWFKAVTERPSVKETWSDDERYLAAYKRYADNTTNSLVGQATRAGSGLP
jgi:glutathione S-transferase